MGKVNFYPSIKDTELKDGEMKAVRIRGQPILLVKQGGQVFGMFNRCPHMGCSFERGVLSDYLVICPCHGWKFDVRNGQYQEIKLITVPTFTCKKQDGKIYVEIP
jgi:nitrite reductase/ring-hydroxylating ferredoxin subunit